MTWFQGPCVSDLCWQAPVPPRETAAESVGFEKHSHHQRCLFAYLLWHFVSLFLSVSLRGPLSASPAPVSGGVVRGGVRASGLEIPSQGVLLQPRVRIHWYLECLERSGSHRELFRFPGWLDPLVGYSPLLHRTLRRGVLIRSSGFGQRDAAVLGPVLDVASLRRVWVMVAEAQEQDDCTGERAALDLLEWKTYL